MPEMPKLKRDVRIIVPTRSLSTKVALLCGAALASVGAVGQPPVSPLLLPQPVVINTSAPTAQKGPAPLVLSQQDPISLLAQHRSHASHASHASHTSHYSGVTGVAPSPPAKTTPDSSRPENQPSKAPDATPETSRPVQPSRAIATITSSPAAADVEVDGNFVGNSGSALNLPPGQHVITVKKSGYEPWTRTITVNEGSSIALNANLTPTKKTRRKTTATKK